MDRSVRPPSAQWIKWWASVHAAGALQPGKVQCRSRAHRFLSWAQVNSRFSRPWFRISPEFPTTTEMMAASQASLRTVSGAIGVPVARVPAAYAAPTWARRSS